MVAAIAFTAVIGTLWTMMFGVLGYAVVKG
jgi:hypothetical protein